MTSGFRPMGKITSPPPRVGTSTPCPGPEKKTKPRPDGRTGSPILELQSNPFLQTIRYISMYIYIIHKYNITYFFLSPCTSCRAVTALKLGALAPDDTRAKLYVAAPPSKCYDFEHQTLDNLYG